MKIEDWASACRTGSKGPGLTWPVRSPGQGEANGESIMRLQNVTEQSSPMIKRISATPAAEKPEAAPDRVDPFSTYDSGKNPIYEPPTGWSKRFSDAQEPASMVLVTAGLGAVLGWTGAVGATVVVTGAATALGMRNPVSLAGVALGTALVGTAGACFGWPGVMGLTVVAALAGAGLGSLDAVKDNQ